MRSAKRFSVLVATDGSAPARAAVAAAAVVPWPPGARVGGVVARGRVPAEVPAAAWPAIDAGLARIADDARGILGRRWPGAEVAIVAELPADAIIGEARRLGARVIVVGARGGGALSRLVLGSVSRSLVRKAPCAVLVVKRRMRATARVVLGVDGSAHARRATALLAALRPARTARVTVLSVVEPLRLPSLGLLPGAARSAVAAGAASAQAAAVAAARRHAEAAARVLRGAGWRARPVVALGVPADELLRRVRAERADLVVVGERGVGGVARLFLGSVAEGVLRRSAASVLIGR